MTYDRSERQPEGIIEWADDKHDTLGLFTDDRAHGGEVQRECRAFGFSPLVDAGICELGFCNGCTYLKTTVPEGRRKDKNEPRTG